MTNSEKALLLHKEWNGKIETVAKSKVNSREDLALAYTPGVAEPCKVIAENKEAAYTYTMKANTVAVISDGSAVLGLGNIGAHAAMPVMEGKAVLFKEFGGVNAVPICLDTQDTEELIKTITYLAPNYGGINLEDICRYPKDIDSFNIIPSIISTISPSEDKQEAQWVFLAILMPTK